MDANEENAAHGTVLAVQASPTHTMRKEPRAFIRLLAGQGVEGDAHAGETVKHRSRVAKDPTQPNLRQVHLIHAELFAELAPQGFALAPGAMGENITTRGLDVLSLPTDAELHLGSDAIVRITGLRNPCGQLNGVQPGLMKATRRGEDENGAGGEPVRLAGVMGVVVRGGVVQPGDEIRVALPPGPHERLAPV